MGQKIAKGNLGKSRKNDKLYGRLREKRNHKTNSRLQLYGIIPEQVTDRHLNKEIFLLCIHYLN